MLARGQQQIGGLYTVERATAAERVQADAAGDEPAHQRAAQIRRIVGERHAALRELGMDRAQACPRADHTRARLRVELDRIEPRKIEREAAIVRHRAAHRSGGRAAQRDRHRARASPAQRRDALRDRERLEDEIRHRPGEQPREETAEIHVLVAVGLAAQQLVRDDAIFQRARRGVALERNQRLQQRAGQLGRAPWRLTNAERPALLEEEVQIRDGSADGARALLGAERDEILG